jgi:tRNA U38,U39,U40 pseudouridine synthase TruA
MLTQSGLPCSLLQVISFYTWQQHVGPAELQSAINQQLQAAIPTKQPLHNSSSSSNGEVLLASCQARVWDVAAVDREFHATFSAQWRRYVYLLPLRQQQQQQQQQQHGSNDLLPRFTDELAAALQPPARKAAADGQPPQQQGPDQQQQELLSALQVGDVDTAVVNALLQQLQGRQLNYYAYARDTPRGKDCECTLHVARASLVHLPATTAGHAQTGLGQQNGAATAGAAADQGQQQQQQQAQGVPCLCIELAGDRFLRRMVRVLVATAVREALLLQQGRAASICGTDDSLHTAAAAATEAATAVAAAGGDVVGGKGGSPAGSQALVALAASMDRQATAPPAPALGLCFAAVGY